jgi:hypothetical protein
MLSELPPVHLLFDLGALLVGKTREWQEFSKVGQCFLPQVVHDELLALANTESHPQKKTAQEFLRFLSGSNWQLTRAIASHPQLQPLPEQHLGKRSRLALSVTESAYGTARGSVGRMVVLVSNDQASLRRIQDLKIPNLTGLPVSAVLIWSRTDRRPAVVVQHMHEMVERSRAFATAQRSNTAVASRPTLTSAPTRTASNLRQPAIATRPSVFPQLLSSVSSVLALAIAVSLVWYLLQPRSFNQFLQQNNLPTFPQLPGAK